MSPFFPSFCVSLPVQSGGAGHNGAQAAVSDASQHPGARDATTDGDQT